MITAPLLASALFASSVVALPNAHGEIIANFARAAPAPPTPGNFTSNATQTTINGLASLAKSGKQHLATYLISQDSRVTSTIYGDWANLPDVSAYYWVADMDVDCDGINYKCKNNPDGQNLTDFGALSAYNVPWIVIPYSFIEPAAVAAQIPGNNLAAVICNGKMFYGIFGDSNGDTPEVIGEASWLLARTCFPNDNLDGGVGHGKADVTYIVFNGKKAVVPSVGWSYIKDFAAFRQQGDKFIGLLAKDLGLGGTSRSKAAQRKGNQAH